MCKFQFNTKDSIEEMVTFWHAAVSRPIQIPVLIEAIGILNTAIAEEWLSRAVRIGDKLRKVIAKYAGNDAVRERISGQHALLWLDRKLSDQFLVMAAIRRRSK
jgi:hypothetical protein